MAAEENETRNKRKRPKSLAARILKLVAPRSKKGDEEDGETRPMTSARDCTGSCRVRLEGMERGEQRIRNKGGRQFIVVRSR